METIPDVLKVRSNLDSYLKIRQNDGNTLSVDEPKYDGWVGTKFRASRTRLDIYWQNGARKIKVAEVGIILRPETKLQKIGEFYAEELSVRDASGKHMPIYIPDIALAPRDRVLSESMLVKIARGSLS